MIRLRRLRPEDDDLELVAEQLNDPVWEDFDNQFTAESLQQFLQSDEHVYLVAYLGDDLAGAAHAYVMEHPAGVKYFYIDEVDTAKPHRRRGVATALMRELFNLAREFNATEAWLGADEGNDAAYALYRSLRPSDEEPGTIFTYKID